MTSTLILYLNSKIYPNKNFKVDDISTYLATLTNLTISDFQYVKHSMNLEVKVNKSQTYLNPIGTNNYNYCSIQNDSEKTYYYFIIDKKWTSKETIRLVLVMDVLNTFAYGTDYQLDNKTLVNRQHFDRFTKPSSDLGGDVFLAVSVTELVGGKEYVLSGGGGSSFNLGDIEGSPIIVRKRVKSSGYSIQNAYTGDKISFFLNSLTLYLNGNAVVTITRSDVINPLYAFTIYSPNAYTESFVTNIDGLFYPRLLRNIPIASEGINPVLYGQNKELIRDDGQDWYLVYKGSTLRAYLTNGEGFTANLEGDNQIDPIDIADSIYYYILPDENDNRVNVVGKVDGQADTYISAYIMTLGQQNMTYKEQSVLCFWKDGQDIKAVNFIYYDLGLGFFYVRSSSEYTFENLVISHDDNVTYRTLGSKTSNTATIRAGSSGAFTITPSSYDCYGINSLDRYASDLYKIIKLPYCPVSNFNGWRYDATTKMIYLEDLDTLFNKELTPTYNPLEELTYIPNLSSTARNKDVESKLYHSDFYQPKFIYDSFVFTYNLELVNLTKYTYSSSMSLTFNMTNTINSRFMFTFPSYITDGNSLSDYDNVIVVARNNEVSIFTSDFVEYLRNGYNYEVKNKERAEAFQWTELGVGVASKLATYGIGGGGLSSGVSLAGSVTNQLLGAINTTIQSEASLRQKVYQLSRQNASVSGSDDVDLMSMYSGNKAKYMIYKMSDRMRTILADLFFYSGYIDGTTHTPNVTSRTLFNFVSCDAVIDNKANIPEEVIDELVLKFNSGVTFIHHYKNSWDFEQTYENWEVSLV